MIGLKGLLFDYRCATLLVEQSFVCATTSLYLINQENMNIEL